MCYSGKCYFENHMGDCQAYGYDKICAKIPFRYSPCALGGMAMCPEDEEFIEEAKHNLVFQYLFKQLKKKTYSRFP